MKKYKEHLLVFIFVFVLSVLFALLSGQDINWDQRNYHYYITVTWLRGEIFNHVAPAMMQSWMNPLGLLPTTLPIYLFHPVLATLLLCIYPAVNGVLLYMIAKTVMKPWLTALHQKVLGGFSVAFGCISPAFISEIGSTSNDVFFSIFVLLSALVLVRALNDGKLNTYNIILAGLFMGFATGLKMVAAVYFLAQCISLLFFMRNFRTAIVRTTVYCLSGLAGFLLIYGYWGFILWDRFGNPMFPFYNGIFKSQWYPTVNFTMNSYIVRDFIQLFKYSYHGLFFGKEHSEMPVRYLQNFLFSVLAILILIKIIGRIKKGGFNRSFFPSHCRPFLFLFIFSSLSTLIWLLQFGILRYHIPVTLMNGALISAMLMLLIQRADSRRLIVLSVLFMACFAVLKYPNRGRIPYSNEWYESKLTKTGKQEGVLYMMNSPGTPYGYIVPFFPKTCTFIGTSGNIKVNQIIDTKLFQAMKEKVRSHEQIWCIYLKGKRIDSSFLEPLRLRFDSDTAVHILIRTKHSIFLGRKLSKVI